MADEQPGRAPFISTIIGYVIESDERHGDGGFLQVRRMRLRVQRADGSLSAPFLSDYVERPYGLDAVVVCLYRIAADGRVEVLLRRGQRPALYFGREGGLLRVLEVVAGIIEAQDLGEQGIRRRAQQELWEEAGVRLPEERLRRLGGPSYPAPGLCPERLHYFCAELLPGEDRGLAPPGDGSPMEEGADLLWVSLREALGGVLLEDGKTEICLYRLRDHLGGCNPP